MLKRLIFIIAGMILLIGIWAGFGYLFQGIDTGEQEVVPDRQLEDLSANELIEYAANKPEEESDGAESNPFGDIISMENLDRTTFLEYLHAMSHQKVKAEQKFGFYQITEERINWLVEAVDESGLDVESSYMDILNRWAEGDFSQVVDDHNLLYREASMESGELGWATDVLSEEEEQAYIENKIDLGNVKAS
ncbi:DUF6241 domain-containing protein [Lentibacillus sediminis]|uniref:DUF6241 domain-containing protein n=1 Tax=Lentibacillus sediminis TaxID=1940529 RepID=UPI000C1C26B2|nr:DUF6241 domain-containing protein [Lentibacillus sediminis]